MVADGSYDEAECFHLKHEAEVDRPNKKSAVSAEESASRPCHHGELDARLKLAKASSGNMSDYAEPISRQGD